MKAGRAAVVAVLAVAALVVPVAPGGAASGAPFGVVDWIRADADGRVTASGWVVDPDTDAPVDVHLYVGDRLMAKEPADHPRPDVGDRHARGDAHGYRVTVDGLADGLHPVCVWAIDIPGGAGNRRIGCVDVRIGAPPSPPRGVVDAIRNISSRTVEVRGWAFDRDRPGPTPLHIYVDGALAGTAATGRARPDVASVFGVDPDTGFATTVEVAFGTHEVCVWAINRPAGPNVRLTCRIVNVVDRDPPAGPRGRVVVNGTGDVRADPHWYGSPPDYSPAMAGLGGLFVDDGLTVVNLECAPSPLGAPIPKNYNFRCDDRALANLAASGVDVANMANNHALDFGTAAMVDGIGRVTASGMHEVGAGLDPIDAHQPYLTEIAGRRIAVLGMAGFVEFDWNLAAPGRPGLADGYDIAAMQAAVRRADALADTVIVSIHWGNEGVTVHNASQAARARALVDAGADIVFGHHPHRLQPVERHRDGIVFYSLGNFVWPRLSPASADTAVGQVVIEPDGRMRPCLLHATIRAHGRVWLDEPARRRC